ncbi:APC family permease [Nocardioides sp. BYT-33-1]|uniref:APC family permease n=1 Tax=Nocardioides sp. BYT-33-1 TaxID=3416952 RepID=UPI003F53A0BE
MTDQMPPDGPASPGRARLRTNAIAYPGLVFVVIAITAPLTTMSSNYSLSLVLGAGPGTFGLTLLLTGVLALFAAGYIAISKHVVNAGSGYAFVAYGLGRPAGAATAMALFIAYNLAAAAMTAGAGYFAVVFGQQYLSLDLPWWCYGGLVLAGVAWCGYRGLVDTKRVFAVISCVGFTILVALCVAVVVQRPTAPTLGLGDDALSPAAIGFTMAMIAVSFAGFETTASYGEETGDGGRSIGPAIYTALAALCAIYLFSTWSLVAAFEDLGAAAGADPGMLVPLAADTYLGSWSGPVISGTAVLSFGAGAVAWHNAAVRYMFAFGRSGLLPRAFVRTDGRGIPVVAVTAQVALVLAVLAPFALAGYEPLTELFPAIAGINTVAYVSGLIMLSLSVLAASLRGRLGDTSALVGRVAPVLAITCFVAVLWFVLTNYGLIVGSEASVVRFAPAVLVVGAVVAAALERRQAALGRAPASLSVSVDPAPSS